MSTILLTGYKLTFDEEFNTRSISQNGEGTKWADIRPEFRLEAHSDIGFGKSSFVDSSSGYDPFKVENGVLTITAQPDGTPHGYPGNWESGLIHTKGEFSQKYGYFEVRADLSGAPGSWDAFWLMPENPSPTKGPEDHWQEWDIVEHYGDNDAGVYEHIHTTHRPPPGEDFQFYYSNNSVAGDSYHTYGALWTPTKIEYYFDGNLIGTKSVPPDFDVPMYILANLAVGDTGQVNGPHPRTKIDYIRVFSNDPNAVAVKQDTVSAPDGTDPGLYGATTLPNTSMPMPTPTPTPPTSATNPLSEAGDLKVQLSGDQYMGAPKAEISVDGVVVGTFDVTANHKTGEWQDVIVKGNGRWADGADHDVSVKFLNDQYDWAPDKDRNLWFKEAELNGVKAGGAEQWLNSGGLSAAVRIDDFLL